MNIAPAFQKIAGRSLAQAHKYSPQVLTAVGIVGVVTAGVLAARATLKLEATIDEGRSRLENAKSLVEGGADNAIVTKAVVKNSTQLVKLYWGPVTLGVASLVCIVSAHGILQKRNVALVAAYKGLESAFASYRERVVEEYGEEVDQDFRLGVRTEEVEDEKGKKKTVKVIPDAVDSDYLYDFNPSNPNWTGFGEHNLFFLQARQNLANDLLRSRGHVFLNEILDGLALPRTKAGAVTGWVYDAKNPEGDNYIDFGIRDWQEEKGYILLDFNVDGTILDKI